MSTSVFVSQGGLAGVPTAEEALLLAAAITAELTGRKMHLFQNNYTPNKGTTLTNLVEATFDGYAVSAAIVWGSPFYDVNGTVCVQGGASEFLMNGSTTPNVVYGWYITDVPMSGPPTKLVAAYRFDNPATMANVGDAIIAIPVFSFTLAALGT